MTRVLVCGGRDFDDFGSLNRELHRHDVSVVIHGNARGADWLADRWARANAVDRLAFPADWETHGRAAGPKRNQRMLDEGRPDLVIAFPGGRGTADMVRRARKAGVKVIEVSARTTALQETGE